MKKYIKKLFKGNDYSRILFVLFFLSPCLIAHCQDNRGNESLKTIFSMTPQYSEKELDSLKWNIVTLGDESSFFECELALWSKSKANASILYKEFFQYTLIMAFVYEHPAACQYVYTLLYNYRKERGEDLTEEELRLCIKSLAIGSLNGCGECETWKIKLSSELDAYNKK